MDPDLQRNFDQDAAGADTTTDDQLHFATQKVNPDSDVVNFMLIGRDTGTMGDECARRIAVAPIP